MAEAPECAVFSDFLDTFSGSTLVAVDAKQKYDVEGLTGKKLVRVLSVGKSILFTFDDKDAIEIESVPGRSGSWTSAVENSNYEIKFLFRSETEDRLAFFCANEEDKSVVWRKVTPTYISSLSYCVIRDAPDITFEYIRKKARQRPSMTVSTFLCDQSVVSGIGRYLKSDIIFNTRINPHMKMVQFTDAELATLTKNILFVAKLSYKAGGCESATKCTMPGKDGMYIPFIFGRAKFTSDKGLEYPVIHESIGKSATYWVDWDAIAADDEEE